MKRLSGGIQSVVKAAGIAVCSVLVVSVFMPRAFAADRTWTGLGGDGNWFTAANWSDNAVPNGTADVAIFDGVTATVAVSASHTVKSIFSINGADATITIAAGARFTISNGGGAGLGADGGNLTINGPGQLGMTSASDTNHLDNGANAGSTLAIHAEIVDASGGTSTGLELWRTGGSPKAGDVILGYAGNAFVRDMSITYGHTVSAHKLAPAGQPSCLGAISTIRPSRNSVLRYTGTGDTAGYAFLLNGGEAALGYGAGIDQSGTGPLTWTGPIYNSNNSSQTLTLLGDSAAPAFITGPIYTGTGTLGIRKHGAGTWVLAGSNSFTGVIAIDAGTLGFDTTNAVGSAAQITMASGAALVINPSATDGFITAFPTVHAHSGIALTIHDAPTVSEVTFAGLAGGPFAITAPGAGTAVNRIFIAGYPTGPVGPWLTLNGSAATYDPVNGLTPVTLTTQGVATKGDTLPNGAMIQAEIDTVGAGGHIQLPANPTRLFSLTQTVPGDDATVELNGKTLMVNALAIAAGADALTIGAAPQDGAFMPLLQVATPPAIPDSTVISNLNPIIWYDPSEAATVTLSGNAVIGLANKGTLGATHDAVVPPNFAAPLYATGGASHAALPMLKLAVNNQGLLSAASTGISGTAPRTLIAVQSKEPGTGPVTSIGSGSSGRAFEVYCYSDTVFRFGTFSGDRDFTGAQYVPIHTPIVASFVSGVNGVPTDMLCVLNGTDILTHSRASGFNTADTPLNLGHRNAGASTCRGQIGEVLLFDYTLTDPEREAVEAYLVAKWRQSVAAQATTLSLRNDSAAPLTVNATLSRLPGATVSLIKDGLGDVTLAGGATLVGPTVIAAGALTVATPPGVSDAFHAPLSGAGRLAKDGPGTLLLPNTPANTYAGGTDILGGILSIGNNASLGTGPVAIADGATLDVGAGLTANGITLPNRVTAIGAGAGGIGAIANNGPLSQYNTFQSTTVTLTGDTTFGAVSRWDFRGAEAVLDLAGHKLAKTGAGPLYFANGSVVSNAPAGMAIHVQQGHIGLHQPATILEPNDPSRQIVIDSGAGLILYNQGIPVHWTVIPADDAEITATAGGTATNINVLTSDIALPGTLRLTADGEHSKNLSGQITGPGGLFVHGGGSAAMSLLMHPQNTYAGATVVSNALLGLRHVGSLPDINKLSLPHAASGVRVYADGNGNWSSANIKAFAESGAFTSATRDGQRLEVEVGTGETAFLTDNIGAPFQGQFIKTGPGTLVIDDAHIASPVGDIRNNGGTLILSNSATLTTTWSPVASHVYLQGVSTNILCDDAQITGMERGYNQGTQSSLGLAQGDNKTILELRDNAQVTHKMVGGGNGAANTPASSAGALYLTGNSRFTDTGGAGNVSAWGMYGHLYAQIDDDSELFMKGSVQMPSQGSGIGMIRQTGGRFIFNGQRESVPASGTVGNSYGGYIAMSRPGTALLHLEGGTFEHYGPLTLLENGGAGGNATLTVTGTADAMVDRPINMGDRTDATASINIRNGGRLTVPQINRILRAGALTHTYVNFDGGTLRVTNTVGVASGRLLDVPAPAAAPLSASIYAGGATVEIAEGLVRSIHVPLRQPIGRGVTALTVNAVGAGYIAPPSVTLSGGGGSNATAIAHIDRAAGHVTGFEVTNPGFGYTSNPTVTLAGGGGSDATAIVTLGVSEPGGLTKTGGGTLSLNAENTYSGPTVVSGGTLRLGAGPQTLSPHSALSITGGTLDLGGATHTNYHPVTIEDGGILNGAIAAPAITKTGPGTITVSAVPAAPIPPDTIIQLLAPVIWYDPADASTVELNGDRVTRLRNKGSAGDDLDAIPYNNGTGPRYLTGSGSPSPLGAGILQVDTATATMTTAANVPLSGTAPRTLVALIARDTNRGVIGIGSGANGASFEIGNESSKTYVSGLGSSRDTDITSPIPAVDQLTFIAGANGYGGNLARGVQAWRCMSAGAAIETLTATWPADMGTAAAPFSIARRGTGTYRGKYGAIFLFDRTLTEQEITALNTAIAAKYLAASETSGETLPFAIEEGTVVLASRSSADTVARLNPVVWYDPSDASTVTLDGFGRLTSLRNKGTQGGMDASSGIVNGSVSLIAPLLAADAASYAVAGLPMISIDDNNEGLASASNLGITGAAPRTSFGVFARHDNLNEGAIVSFGAGSTRRLWEFGDRANAAGTSTTVLGTYSDDLAINTITPSGTPDVFCILHADARDIAFWRTAAEPSTGTRTLGGDLDTADSRFMIGQRSGVANRADFRGQIGEQIVFDRALPEAERDAVQRYLVAKWRLGTTISDDTFDGAVFNVALGATLDLGGAPRAGLTVTGNGTLANGTLGDGAAISPAGDSAVGELTLDNITFGPGSVYRVTVEGPGISDVLTFTTLGAVDLTGLTVVPSNAASAEPGGSKYLIATALNGFTGIPAVEGFTDGRKWQILKQGGNLYLTTQQGTLILLY